jgi:hypothetical protein
MRRERKQHTPEEKGAILHRHLMDGVPVSTVDSLTCGGTKSRSAHLLNTARLF